TRSGKSRTRRAGGRHSAACWRASFYSMRARMKTKEEAREIITRIEEQIHKVIIGQDDLIRRILIALFGRIPYSFKKGDEEKAGSGHILLEGVPGLAKTLLVSAIANTINARFQRIQFTPDMLP